MTPSDLQHYLHEHIPLSAAMEISVVSVEEGSVVLSAPLAPNINHRETVFGGSASAVAILAAWSLVHTRLVRTGVESRIVIQRNTMEYLRPIDGSFTATSRLAEPERWETFLRTLQRRGAARIAVESDLSFAGASAGAFRGEFVAFGSTRG